ncbi:MAG: transcriptional regulator [Sphingobacteriales bacterium]|nr:MAG: transcriptional regulator [Sphingobacteriales bacterium]
MESLKYKVIKTKKQYDQYCSALEGLCDMSKRTPAQNDEIELLTLLVQKWDDDHKTFGELDPVQLLKSLMAEHGIKAKDLVTSLHVSKGLVSDILNYKKGLSKEIIRELAAYFKLSQEAFNRPYKLVSPMNIHLKNASVMNTEKRIASAS